MIKVVLAEMPSLLADVITDIIALEEDIEIIPGNWSAADLFEISKASDVDFVILVGRSDSEVILYEDLLLQTPHVRVLAIVGAGRRGRLFEMRPSCVSLGELSPKIVLKAIRSKRPSLRQHGRTLN
jgi:hypothetical protein